MYTLAGNPGANNKNFWQYTGLNYIAAPNGTCVNVLPPQNLTNLGYLYNGAYNVWGNSSTYFTGAKPALAFDWCMRAYVAVQPATDYPVSGAGFQGTLV